MLDIRSRTINRAKSIAPGFGISDADGLDLVTQMATASPDACGEKG